MSISRFIETIDPYLYQEYRKEKFLEFGKKRKVVEETIPKVDVKEILDDPFRRALKISRLPSDHYARQYVESRHFSLDDMRELYFVPKFGEWCNSFLDNKFESESSVYEEPRLIIPFFNKHKLHALQGRSFNPKSDLKYLTIVIDHTVPSVFGLNKVDMSKEVFVLEGPLDAISLGHNSIATAGGDLISKLDSFDKAKLTIVYDNESRSITTIKKMQRTINNGYKIVVWPSTFAYKDINEAIVSGMTKEKLVEMIKENTYKSLSANLALNSWRKV